MQITVCKVFKGTKNKQKTRRKRKMKKQIFTLIELLVKETCLVGKSIAYFFLPFLLFFQVITVDLSIIIAGNIFSSGCGLIFAPVFFISFCHT